MEIQIAVSKVNRYGSADSGDSLEVVERPNGGVSVVLADGQSSGKSAKHISAQIVRKVIALLAEGVRDGASARAASDFLYTEHEGKITGTLNVISVDLETDTMVITRNNPAPVFVLHEEKIDCMGAESVLLGSSRNIRPSICEIPLEAGLTVVMYTDGISHAGVRYGRPMDVITLLQAMVEDQSPTAKELADTLLANATRLDNGAPEDDMSVVVLCVIPTMGDDVRRMTVRIPVKPD